MTCFSMRPSPSSSSAPAACPTRSGPSLSDDLVGLVRDRDLVIILGAGRFGARAVRILSRQPGRALWVVDRDENRLLPTQELPVRRIHEDGIDFLVSWIDRLPPETMIVPAIPIHVAAEWLYRTIRATRQARIVPVPEDVRPFLPHTWVTENGSLLISYADFLCPEDCPEPEDGCTVTGEIRTPLYQVMAELPVQGFSVHVIQSHQLAPGLGGYRVADLREIETRILDSPETTWLIGTACRCHGTMTGLEMTGGPQGR